MTTKDLTADEYNPYYQPYIDKVLDCDLFAALSNNHEVVISTLENMNNTRLLYRYAVGKWSIKEIILHMIDTERIFSYRALKIARGDTNQMTGFDENLFAKNSNADERSIESLLNEYKVVRLSTIALFNSFTPSMLIQTGIASSSKVSVRAIAFILLGHEKHHLQIINERYL